MKISAIVYLLGLGAGLVAGQNAASDVLLNDVARVRMPQDFLTFCIDQKANNIHDGTQKRGVVTCSNTVQGVLPSSDRMISTIITAPANNANIPEGQTFTVSVRSVNINYGFFNNPDVAYYAQPQTLDAQGNVEGHQHITIQKIEANGQPPPAATPVFFKGLNQDSPDGTLSEPVPGGITGPGVYRICTMTSSSGHQPVLMPVARRGAQDDCIRINIVPGQPNAQGASTAAPKAVDVSQTDVANANAAKMAEIKDAKDKVQQTAQTVSGVAALTNIQNQARADQVTNRQLDQNNFNLAMQQRAQAEAQRRAIEQSRRR